MCHIGIKGCRLQWVTSESTHYLKHTFSSTPEQACKTEEKGRERQFREAKGKGRERKLRGTGKTGEGNNLREGIFKISFDYNCN